MDTHQENELAAALAAIFARHEATPPFKRMRVRIRELGADQRDEVLQFKQLQRACRESSALAADFVAQGFGDLTAANTRAPDAMTGVVIQAFNRFVEARWED